MCLCVLCVRVCTGCMCSQSAGTPRLCSSRLAVRAARVRRRCRHVHNAPENGRCKCALLCADCQFSCCCPVLLRCHARWCRPGWSLAAPGCAATGSSGSTPASATRAASTPTHTTWTVSRTLTHSGGHAWCTLGPFSVLPGCYQSGRSASCVCVVVLCVCFCVARLGWWLPPVMFTQQCAVRTDHLLEILLFLRGQRCVQLLLLLPAVVLVLRVGRSCVCVCLRVFFWPTHPGCCEGHCAPRLRLLR